MSAIAAFVHWDGLPVDPAVLHAANTCQAYRCPDGAWVWADGAIGMAQIDLATLSEDQPGVPCRHGHLHIVADCRIDNRDQLRGALPDAGLRSDTADVAYILAAYAAWGEHCVDRLIGDFAFVIWDARERTIFAARDFSGMRPLYYYRDRDRLLLASDRTQILQDPTVPFVVDDEQITEYLVPTYHYSSGWDQGLLKGFYLLGPGWSLLAKDGHVNVQRFWEWRDCPPANPREDEVLESYLHTLEEAVRCRLRSRNGSVAIELSGGLDSPALAALAARITAAGGPELHTLSMIFDEYPEIDERGRINALLQRYPNLQPHFLAADHLHDPTYIASGVDPQNIVGIYEFTSMSVSEPFYNLALANGCQVVLTGDNGDTLNTGSSAVYFDLLRRGRLGEVWRWLRSDWRRSPRVALGALAYYGLLPTLPWSLLQPGQLWLETRAGSYFDLPEYMPAPVRKQVNALDRAIRRYRAADMRVRCPAARETLSTVLSPMIACTATQPRPIDYRYPYSDRRLVEMVLRIPQELRWQREAPRGQQRGRMHHRKAFDGILPDQVRVANPGVDFSPVVNSPFQSPAIQRWLRDAPAIYIAERGYVHATAFLAEFEAGVEPHFYTGGLVALEAWLRAAAPGGSFHKHIPPRRTRGTITRPADQPQLRHPHLADVPSDRAAIERG